MSGIDMTAAAVSRRLRKVAAISDLRTGKRLDGKIDMSATSVTNRLREVERLRRLCLRLGRLVPTGR